MKVKIVKTNRNALHGEEFVKPVVEIVKSLEYEVEIEHIRDIKEINGTVIITGTSLRDFDYLQYAKSITISAKAKVLGICAGMQIVASAHDIKLKKQTLIGMKDITCIDEMKTRKAYFLTSYVVEKKESIDVLCTYHHYVVGFKVKNYEHYGVAFHPEVRNEHIIKNFLRL